MEKISTIGIDIAKKVLQVHGIDETGEVIVRRQLRRRQVMSFFSRLPKFVDNQPKPARVATNSLKVTRRLHQTNSGLENGVKNVAIASSSNSIGGISANGQQKR